MKRNKADNRKNKTAKTIVIFNNVFSIPLLVEATLASSEPPPKAEPAPACDCCNKMVITIKIDTTIKAVGNILDIISMNEIISK